MGVPTGSNLGAARGSLTIDTSQAERAPSVMQGVASGIERNMERIDASTQRAERGVGNLAGTLRELAGAFGFSMGVAGAVQFARMTVELANNAAQAERTKDQYEVLAAGVGESSEEMLDAMRRASQGMISDNELILSANRAMLLGVAKNSEELAQMLEASRVLGQAMGQDVGKSFNDLVIGLGRLSPLILDNLGIANEGEQMFENYARSVGRTADSLTKAEKKQILLNQVMDAAAPLLEAEGERAENTADKTDRLGAAWDNYTDQLGESINTFGGVATISDGLSGALETQTGILQTQVDWWNKYTTAVGEAGAAFERWLGLGTGQLPPSGIGAPPWLSSVNTAMDTPKFVGFAPERRQAKLDWFEDVTNLNERTHDQIVELEEDFGRQRADAVRDYQQSIAREAQDFAIARQRQEQDLVDNIADIHADAARREQRMAEDLARSIAQAQADSAERVADWERDRGERIAEAREASAERIAEIEERYNESRERAERDHRDRLEDAAGRLDAIAVREEQKRFARESQDAKEAHDDQLAKERENLQERIDEINKAHARQLEDEAEALAKSIRQRQEAYQRQLDDAREADRLRIEDMKADFEERKRREDEDRAIRLGRMAQDHQDQLDEMSRQHGLRLDQIEQHAKDERQKIDDEFEKELAALGKRTERYAEKVKKQEEAATDAFDRWWAHATGALLGGSNPGTGWPSLQDPYGSMLPVPSVNTNGSASNSRSVSFSGDITVNIAGSTNMGEDLMYDVARRAFIDALKEMQ